MKIFRIAGQTLLLGAIWGAQNVMPQAQPASLIPENAWPQYYLAGVGPDNRSYPAVVGMPFQQAVQLRTPSNAVNPWDIAIGYQPDAKLKRGTTLLATFYIRAVEPAGGTVYTRFIVQKASEPYTKSAEWHATATSQWRKIQVPFTAAEDYETRSWSVQFWIPSGPQVIQIGGLRIEDYGTKGFQDLPLDVYPYEGAAANADWRAKALQRIEQNRKVGIVVSVHDENGRVVPNAAVKLTMQKHEFGFGTAVAHDPLMAGGSDGDNYRNTLSKWFNKAVIENDLKWPIFESDPSKAMDDLSALRGLGLTNIRGHNLVWPGIAYLPDDIPGMVSNPNLLRQRVATRVTNGAAAVKGQVTEWDVVNEPVTNRDLQKVLGDAEVGRWFQLARAADPAAKLYANDYSVIESGGEDLPHQNAYWNTIKALIDQGAPVDGIGLEGHFGQQLTGPERVLQILDRYAKLGKTLQITEFDVDHADETVQAAYTRDLLIAAFSHPAVNGFLTWGFWEGSHWNPRAAMIRKNWRWKPSGEVWKDLIYREWWTDVNGGTDNSGAFRTRGFRGDYELTVTINGQTKTYPVKVTGRGTQYVRIGKHVAGSIGNGGVVNAASYKAGPVAPGELVTVFGDGFGGTEPAAATVDENGELPALLGDTQVLFDGKPATVVGTAPGQATAIVPSDIRVITEVAVVYQGLPTEGATFPAAEAVPGVFTVGGGTGQALAFNRLEDGSTEPNSAEHPAAAGSVMSLYVTGEGRTGQTPVIAFGGVRTQAASTAAAFPGVTQLDVVVPATAPKGSAVALTVLVSGISSQSGVTVAIQ